jgi:hypothetical protein
MDSWKNLSKAQDVTPGRWLAPKVTYYVTTPCFTSVCHLSVDCGGHEETATNSNQWKSWQNKDFTEIRDKANKTRLRKNGIPSFMAMMNTSACPLRTCIISQ